MSKQSLKKSFVRTFANVLARETNPGLEGACKDSSSWPIKLKYCLCKNKDIFTREAKIINEVDEQHRKPYLDKLIESGALGKPRTTEAGKIIDEKIFNDITIAAKDIIDMANNDLDELIDVDVFEYKGIVPDSVPLDLYDMLLTARIIPEPIDTETKK